MATSNLEINAATDDEEDEQINRDSEVSSASISSSANNQTSSDFYQSTGTISYSSEANLPISSLSMVALTSNQSLVLPSDYINVKDDKPKSGVRNLLKKIFSSSTNVSYHRRSKSAFSKVSNIRKRVDQLPVVQGPIRLFILRHGERIDRYYSSQWLRQAFDKDENYCRFSPILP